MFTDIVKTYDQDGFVFPIDVISSDKLIMSKITLKKLKSIFSYSKHFKNVNFIFRRVFK